MSKKATSKKKGSRKAKKKSGLAWEEHEIRDFEMHSAVLRPDDLRLIVGRRTGWPKWHIGYWTSGQGFSFLEGMAYEHLSEAKKAAEKEFKAAKKLVDSAQSLRVANRDVGDVVLAARQYQRAVEDELAAMDRGTPAQLSSAQKRKKQAKEALEDLTGANRELLGAMGGAAIGAALGGLLNPVGAAIGALAVGAIGSVVARPSPDEAEPEPPARGRRDRSVIDFPRRPTTERGRAANKRG